MGRGDAGGSQDEPSVAGRGLFRTPGFLVPYLAETQSTAGDQIGRVALSILVFDRTASVGWTALTYALTYLPAILGGFLLGGVGDRFPRVRVMVLTDLARAALFTCVAIPGVPLPVVVGLVAAAFFLGPAFTAAMVSRLATVLAPERFRAASGVRMITAQVAQVGGFAVGGVVVAVVHPRAALLINAGTFALSAVIVAVALRESPVPRSAAADRSPAGPAVTDVPAVADVPTAAGADEPLPTLLRDPWLRQLMLMTALAAFFVVPEGLAVPLAHQLGRGSSVSGLLLAAGPLGSAVGAALLVKLVPHRNGMGVARLMSIACGVPLVATALLPPWPVLFVCWAACGGLWAYQVDVATAFVRAVDERVRARTIARASAVLLGAQGLGLVLFGALGDWLGPQWGVALAGLAGVCSAVTIAWSAGDRDGRRAEDPPRHRVQPRPVSPSSAP